MKQKQATRTVSLLDAMDSIDVFEKEVAYVTGGTILRGVLESLDLDKIEKESGKDAVSVITIVLKAIDLKKVRTLSDKYLQSLRKELRQEVRQKTKQQNLAAEEVTKKSSKSNSYADGEE